MFAVQGSGDIIFTYPEVSGGRTYRFTFKHRTGDNRLVFQVGSGCLTLNERDSDQVSAATDAARILIVDPSQIPQEWAQRPEIFRRCFLGAVRYFGGTIPAELVP